MSIIDHGVLKRAWPVLLLAAGGLAVALIAGCGGGHKQEPADTGTDTGGDNPGDVTCYPPVGSPRQNHGLKGQGALLEKFRDRGVITASVYETIRKVDRDIV